MPVLLDAAPTDLSTFLDAIKGGLTGFTLSSLATIFVSALGMTTALAIAWFGYRFVVRKVSGALKKGKL